MKESLLKRTPWSASITIWRRLWCTAFLIACYSSAPPHLKALVSCAVGVTVLFWIPENRLVLLVRSVAFWIMALMLIHAIPAQPELYVETFPVNSVMQPIQGGVGAIIGLYRYLQLIHYRNSPAETENTCPNQPLQATS
jgi:hypothetical protein